MWLWCEVDALMLKVFLRIWLLVFVPLGFLLFSESLNPIKWMNHWFIYERVNTTYQGTFYLIEDRLSQFPEEQWPEVVTNMADQFGYELFLFSEKQVEEGAELSSKARSVLSESIRDDLSAMAPNDVILVMGDSDALVKRLADSTWWIYMMLDESVGLDTLNQSKGTLNLLQDRFQRTESEHWPELLKELQPEFGFELRLAPLSDLSLSEDLQSQILSSGVAWQQTEQAMTVIYQRLPDQQGLANPRILVAADIPLPGPEIGIWVIALAILVGGISVGIFVFVVLLWRELNALKAATSEFGKGNLQQRAPVKKRSMISDLSEAYNRMAEQIETMVQSQRELTNAMAHDLRTPLSRISFAFEMLEQEDATPEERQRYRKSITSGIDTLDHLIQQILALSRYSRVADMTQFRSVCFADILQHEVEQCQDAHPDLSLALELDQALRQTELWIDPRAMQRLVNNLLSNACRFAQSQIRVRLSLDQANCLLMVEDDGPGIPEEDRDRVFEPFKQLNNDQREMSKEHGLGLAIVHQIVQWHQGQVWVQQSDMGGALFCVRWPLRSERH